MPDFTDYAQDSTYWTIRKRGSWYLVARRRSGSYEEVQRWGWYKRAGAAATAVGVLSYLKGLADGEAMMREALQEKLSQLGLVVPMPDTGPETEPAGQSEDNEEE